MSSSVLSQGDIVLIAVPYTDYSGIKARPALVVSSLHFNGSSADVIMVAFSTNIQRDSQFNIKVLFEDPEFSQTGLKESSTIMCGKIFALDKTCIRRKIGVLPAKFMEQVKQALTHLF